MARFFVYEEYGAKYESTLRDMASASKHIPNWHAYERGIEALAHSLFSVKGRDGRNRKGLTFEDLLIKVIDYTYHTTIADQSSTADSTSVQISPFVRRPLQADSRDRWPRI